MTTAVSSAEAEEAKKGLYFGGDRSDPPMAEHRWIVRCLNEYGETFVVPAGREFRVMHSNRLAEDDMCMATPALAGDRLLIRSDRRPYCIGE